MQQPCQLRVARHAHRKHSGEPRLWERVCSKLMNLVWLLHAHQTHNRRMAQEWILILVLPCHGSDVLHGRNVLDLPKCHGSLSAHAQVFISEERNQRFARTGDPRIAS